jgi:quinol monooxygenase YgiN
MSVVRINEFTCAEGKSDELYKFLKSLVPYISNSDGCVSCEVLQQQDNKCEFVVIEKWNCVEDHTKSIANFPREEMEAAVPLFGAPPKGRYLVS